jgi:hypothetical protein
MDSMNSSIRKDPPSNRAGKPQNEVLEQSPTAKKLPESRYNALIRKGLGHMLSEALYKSETEPVQLEHDSNRFHWERKYGIHVKYPPISETRWVKRLEVEIRMNNVEHEFLAFQAAWLQKLASGEVGFKNLEALKIVIRPLSDSFLYDNIVRELVKALPEVPIVEFQLPTLEIVVYKHSCSAEGCDKIQSLQGLPKLGTHVPNICLCVAAFEKMLVATGKTGYHLQV